MFSLQIDLHPTPGCAASLNGLMGHIYAGNSQSDVRPPAALSVETNWSTTTNGQDPRREYVAVYCDLSGDQLAALEAPRNGASLFFKLDLRVLVQGRHGPGRGDTQLWFEAAPSTWIKILKELGHAEILLLGIELPLHDVPDVLRAAAQEIRRAHQDLLAGHFGEAIRRCRLALDSIDTVLDLEKERERVLQALANSRKAMTKHDRPYWSPRRCGITHIWATTWTPWGRPRTSVVTKPLSLSVRRRQCCGMQSTNGGARALDAHVAPHASSNDAAIPD